jgi:hypothetical protein
MAVIATPPKLQFLDNNGNPLVGGKLYSYAAGTTTPLATFTDAGGGTPNANPVILDSRGEASVWLGTALYKFALYTSTNVLVWTVDNVGGFATLAQLAASGGSALIGFTQAGTGAVTTTVQTKLRQWISLDDFGAAMNGVTDDITAINLAFAAAVAAGGGTVVVPKTSAFSGTITIPTGVDIWMAAGAKLLWIGAASGTCVQTSPTEVCSNAKWRGLTIDTGASFTGTALYIHSAHNIYADVIRLITTGATSTGLKMYADSTAGGDALTKRNLTQVVIDSLVQHGQCGTLIDCDGVTSGYIGDPQVVTLNTINSVFAEACAVYGIWLRNWTDNNTWPGMCRLTVNGNNGVGVQVGSASSVGVYMNQWGMLAVDTFGTLTGRIGMKVENSKLTQVNALYQNPIAEGGEFVSTAAAESYDVTLFRDSDKRIVHYRRLMRAASEGFNSSDPITLADDTAISINVAEGGTDQNITFILTVASNDANSNGVAWLKCRRTAGTAAISTIAGGANFAVTTGVLTGTTGTDTKLTVSANNNGRFYIENRTGASITLTTHIAAWMQTP